MSVDNGDMVFVFPQVARGRQWTDESLNPNRCGTGDLGRLGRRASSLWQNAVFDVRSIPAEPPPHRENWRFAALIVAFRPKYTRYSGLTRRPHREKCP